MVKTSDYGRRLGQAMSKQKKPVSMVILLVSVMLSKGQNAGHHLSPLST